MTREKMADVILRVGLAFAFLFPPLNAIFDPYSWIGYFPQFLRGYVPDLFLLHAFGIVEVIIALWVLSGWKIFYPSVLALLMLVSIVFFNAADFQVLFRDLVIGSIALALAVKNFRH